MHLYMDFPFEYTASLYAISDWSNFFLDHFNQIWHSWSISRSVISLWLSRNVHPYFTRIMIERFMLALYYQLQYLKMLRITALCVSSNTGLSILCTIEWSLWNHPVEYWCGHHRTRHNLNVYSCLLTRVSAIVHDFYNSGSIMLICVPIYKERHIYILKCDILFSFVNLNAKLNAFLLDLFINIINR